MARAEEIVKAAIKHASVVDEAYRYAYQDGFLDGARWADKEKKVQKKENFIHLEDVWHWLKDVKPLELDSLCVFTINGVPLADIHNLQSLEHYIDYCVENVLSSHLIRWAYLEDLMPKDI